MRDFEHAEEQVKAILANDDKSVDAWVRLAVLYDKEKKDDLTEKTVTDSLKANPGHPELILMQGMLFQEKGRYLEAAANYRKVIDAEQTFKAKKNADYNVGTVVQAHFNLATVLDKQGQFDPAMETMKKVIEIQPENADAYNYVGYSYADRGQRLDEAQKYVELAVKLDPENSYYLDSLGWVYFRQGKYPLAKEQFVKALKFLQEKKRKDDAVIYDHLGETLLKLGERTEALGQWRKAVELDPDNKDYAAKLRKNSKEGTP
jgi:tetratricopeptide (TPR) repeat protein